MKPYKPHRIKLDAGEITSRAGLFKFVSILESTAAENIEIAFEQDGEFGEIPKGLSVELPVGDTATYVRFKNPTDSEIEILVVFSAGRIIDNRVVIDDSAPLPIDNSTPLDVAVTGQPLDVVVTGQPLDVEPVSAAPLPYGVDDQILESVREDNKTGSTTMHTVASGKNLYLCSAEIFGSDGAATLSLSVYSNFNTFKYDLLAMWVDGRYGQLVTSSTPIIIPSGYRVKFESSAECTKAFCQIFGYEV